MPRGDTDIPHIAFTHHRIGRHAKERREEVGSAPNLVPTDDCSQLPALDQKRNLGLAYMEIVASGQYPRHLGVFNQRALALLEEVWAAGLREGQTGNALARIYFFWRNDPVRAIEFIWEAIEAPDTTTEVRANALTVLAERYMDERDFHSAGQRLEELTRRRRDANDWGRLGACYVKLNRLDKALPALETALSIHPYQSLYHYNLAHVYNRLGNPGRATNHRVKAQWLSQHNQK
jgi:tetratricopeptide (TPR) repeat protein